MKPKNFSTTILLLTLLILSAGFFLFRSHLKKFVFVDENSKSLTSTQITKNIQPQNCNRIPITETTEGPYFKEGSPKEIQLYQDDIPGKKLEISGYVLDINCFPIPEVKLDFWQADGEGNYDNAGLKLRGHQYTDSKGKYYLLTVIPGEYPNRTPHIHVKIKDLKGKIMTTQLFIPDINENNTDPLFEEKMTLQNIHQTNDRVSANFNFILPN